MKFSFSKALIFGHVLFTTSILAAGPPDEIKKHFAEQRQKRRERKLAARDAPDLQSNGAMFESPPSNLTVQSIVASAAGNASNIAYSGNWAGFVQTTPPSGVWDAIGSAWIVTSLIPPVSGAGTWYGSQWVGIDGYDCDSAILQTGTISYVTIGSDGSATEGAFFWYEWFPNGFIEWLDTPVSPGQKVYGYVQAVDDSEGFAAVENLQTGAQETIELTAPSSTAILCRRNAEWIYEDFSIGSSLAPFGIPAGAYFYDALAVDSTGVQSNLDGSTAIAILQNNEVLAVPTYDTSTSFTVSYPF